MAGFAILLNSEEDIDEGDYVYVETFASFKELCEVEEGSSYPGWIDRVVQAAQDLTEARGGDE